MNDIEKYLAKLKFNAIIYDEDIKSDFDYEICQEYLLSNEFIEALYKRIKTNELTEDIDVVVKENILEIVSFIRNNLKDKEVIKMLNEIITSLNMTYDRNSCLFYRDQFLKRSGTFTEKDKKRCSENAFLIESDFIKTLRYSLIMDHDTVNSMLEDCDDIFINQVVKNELLDDNFINTLNAVYYEMNDMYQIDQFRDRSIYVLKSIKEVILNRSKLYDKSTSYQLDFSTYLRANKLLKLLKK